jgi:hypothetical protein
MKKMTFSFGRLNPPTVGHTKLLDVLKKESKGAEYRMYLSRSHDRKKNPLSFKDKVKYARLMNPKHSLYIMDDAKINTIFDILVKLHDEGYGYICMVVGSDRVSEFETMINKYNGTEARHGFYDFKQISVKSAGDRDPDSEGVEGMSASKMRAAVVDKDFKSFAKGLPKGFKQSEELFELLKKEMGILESFNDFI